MKLRTVKIGALAWAIVVVGGCGRDMEEFKAGQTTKLTVVRDLPPGEAAAAEQVVTDPAKIESLMAILRTGSPAKDHKCADSRVVLLDQRGGRRVQVGTLAGHHGRYYEFRLYRGSDYEIYRVERQAFLSAMARLGITDLDLGGPE